MAKGSNYERELCRKLSEWWTGGKRNDVFWRTSGSGARATHWAKSGQRTAGHHGDIAATDPIGAPLIDLITFEVKRGYSKFTIQDLLDAPWTSKQQKIEEWLQQAIESGNHSGSYGWALIVKRDLREELILLSSSVYCILCLPSFDYTPSTNIKTEVRHATGKGKKRKIFKTTEESIHVMKLDDFLTMVTPAAVRQACEEC